MLRKALTWDSVQERLRICLLTVMRGICTHLLPPEVFQVPINRLVLKVKIQLSF